MSDAAINLRRPMGGAPSVVVSHAEPEDSEVFRTFIREARIAGNEWSSNASDTYPYGGIGPTAEMVLARGKIMGRELLGPGRAVFSAQGKLQVPNGASGTLRLRLYTQSHSTNTDPNVALGSMAQIALHDVAIAAPGAPAGPGILLWDFDMLPLGVGSYGSSQFWLSRVRYQRNNADAVTDVTAAGQINVDFHYDTTWLFTMQKVVGGGAFASTLLDIFSQDGYVRNGESGQATW